jgi:hypothetical protein
VANALLSSYLCSLKYAPKIIMFATCWQVPRAAAAVASGPPGYMYPSVFAPLRSHHSVGLSDEAGLLVFQNVAACR